MAKYFVWNISNTFDVFNSIACNKEFEFGAENQQIKLNSLKKDDCILGVQNDIEIFAILRVRNVSDSKLYLVKEFETSNVISSVDYGIKLSEDEIIEVAEEKYYLIQRELKNVGKDENKIPNSPTFKLPFPHNRILFGAPGTGKSFQLNEEMSAFGNNYERVTFHPNYSYAQFVGTYKPVMKASQNDSISEHTDKIINILRSNESAQNKYDKLSKYFIDNKRNFCSISTLLGILTDEDFSTINKDGTKEVGLSAYVNVGKAIRDVVDIKGTDTNSEISYSYIPGPFIRVLEKALASPAKPYLLLIEEINRANVAAVFGDVFQLLDRDEYNKSQYEIDVSEDLKKYLDSKGINLPNDKLYIPSNMYIWATMNSADQGVFPMDAAFKRRWNFEYLPIDIDKNDEGKEEYKDLLSWKVEFSGGTYNWYSLRKEINDALKNSDMHINEDKLLGPWFIKPDKEDGVISSKAFSNKVLMYLFEDVVKISPSQFFNSDNGTSNIFFSEIEKGWEEKGAAIFMDKSLQDFPANE